MLFIRYSWRNVYSIHHVFNTSALPKIVIVAGGFYNTGKFIKQHSITDINQSASHSVNVIG